MRSSRSACTQSSGPFPERFGRAGPYMLRITALRPQFSECHTATSALATTNSNPNRSGTHPKCTGVWYPQPTCAPPFIPPKGRFSNSKGHLRIKQTNPQPHCPLIAAVQHTDVTDLGKCLPQSTTLSDPILCNTPHHPCSMQTLKYRDAPETPNSGLPTGKKGCIQTGIYSMYCSCVKIHIKRK